MGFRTTKLGERVSVDTRKMSNGESELFEFDEDTKPYFVDYTLTDFIVKMINEKCITTAQIADLSNLEPNYINKLRIGQIKKPSRDKLLPKTKLNCYYVWQDFVLCIRDLNGII